MEALRGRTLALVVAEGLLIKVSERMKRFNAHIRAFDRPLQERPEVFQLVRVDRAVNIRLGMVDDFVGIFVQPIVGLQRIGVQFRTRRDVLADFAMKMMLAARADYRCANLYPSRVRATRTQ